MLKLFPVLAWIAALLSGWCCSIAVAAGITSELGLVQGHQGVGAREAGLAQALAMIRVQIVTPVTNLGLRHPSAIFFSLALALFLLQPAASHFGLILASQPPSVVQLTGLAPFLLLIQGMRRDDFHLTLLARHWDGDMCVPLPATGAQELEGTSV